MPVMWYNALPIELLTEASAMPGITVARLREALSYDPLAGTLTWRVRPAFNSRRRVGDTAGVIKDINGVNHWYVTIDGVQLIATQVAWAMRHGEFSDGRVTAINGDATDIRIENLAEMNRVDGEFDHSTPEGRAAYCRAHRSAHPEQYRDKDLQRRFGIDAREYQRKFVEQKGVCAICAEPETEKRNGKVRWLAVDHDHNTGAIRDLLCTSCNKAIGLMRENTKFLSAAITYLERHASENGNVVTLRAKKVG